MPFFKNATIACQESDKNVGLRRPCREMREMVVKNLNTSKRESTHVYTDIVSNRVGGQKDEQTGKFRVSIPRNCGCSADSELILNIIY